MFYPKLFFKIERAGVMSILTLFGENRAIIPLLVYKVIVKHQEKEISLPILEGTNHALFSPNFNASPFVRANLRWPIYLINLVKEEQIMVSPFIRANLRWPIYLINLVKEEQIMVSLFIRANFHVQWPIYLINLIKEEQIMISPFFGANFYVQWPIYLIDLVKEGQIMVNLRY